jgi:hypothetical protein
MPGQFGYVWCVYQDDNAFIWRLRVNEDYVIQPERGWVLADVDATFPLPRLWLPRKVVGVDEEGRRRHATVATLEADLWTGAVASFLIEGSDQAFRPCQVIASLDEVRR